MAKIIAFDEEARRGLERGLNTLAAAVPVPLRPPGRHDRLRTKWGAPTITNDGVSIAKEIELEDPYEKIGAELVKEVAELGKLPVVLFSAGGVATPADAALMRQLGAEGVFVGSGIFKSGDPAKRAAAIVKATTFYDDPKIIADASRNLGEAMVGINCDTLPETERYANRGW